MSEINSAPDEEPAVLGASDTEALTRDRRRQLRARRRMAKRAHRATAERDGEIVSVFEPHVRYVPPLGPYVRDLWRRRSFAVALAKSKVKGSRSNTVLGGLWALIDPLFMVCLYYFLFSVLRGGTRSSEFIPIIISGILHFQVSSAAVTEGGNSVSSASSLMTNSTFPRMLLPLAAIYGGVLKFLPSIPIIFAAAIFLDAVVGLGMLWWFLLFPLQVLVGLALALLISTAVVFFKDVQNLLNYLGRILFFTSPVIYPISLVAERPEILDVVKWTPFFGIFANYQLILAGDSLNFGWLAISIGWAVGGLCLGGWLFLRHEREFGTRV